MGTESEGIRYCPLDDDRSDVQVRIDVSAVGDPRFQELGLHVTDIVSDGHKYTSVYISGLDSVQSGADVKF